MPLAGYAGMGLQVQVRQVVLGVKEKGKIIEADHYVFDPNTVLEQEAQMLQVFLGKPGREGTGCTSGRPDMFLTSMFATRDEPNSRESNRSFVAQKVVHLEVAQVGRRGLRAGSLEHAIGIDDEVHGSDDGKAGQDHCEYDDASSALHCQSSSRSSPPGHHRPQLLSGVRHMLRT